MSTREERIALVEATWTGPRVPGKTIFEAVVDALYPRQRNSVTLPDGGRMEWHGDLKDWVRCFTDGTTISYVKLSSHALPDDLHAECYKLKGNEWVKGVNEDSAVSICRCGNDITNAANHRCDQCRKSTFGATPAPMNESFTEVAVGEFAPTKDDVNALAELMLATWKRVDPKSSVALYPASYVATFADMARDLLKVYPFKAAPRPMPLGWVNIYPKGTISRIYDTQESARAFFMPAIGAGEQTFPVYRHAQTEAELIKALEECGYTHGIVEMHNKRVTYHSFLKRAGGGK